MAVRGLGRTETCVVHPSRAAVARCGMCHRPVCDECVVSTADGKFCSRECADRAADFRKHYRKPKSASSIVGKLVKLAVWIVIIVVVLGAANKIVFKGGMKVLGPWLNKLPFLGTSNQPQSGTGPGSGPVEAPTETP